MNQLSALFNHLPRSARFMLLSSLGFALMSACVKAVGTTGLPILEIVAARALISLIISYLDIRRKHLPLLGNNRRFLALRGVFGTVGLIAVFYSVTTLPIAQATLLQYTHPTFTAILALIFLKERVHLSTVLCIALSFLGLVVVTAPNWTPTLTAQMSWLSLSAALTGAFASACAYVVVRKLSQTEDASVIILYFPMIAFPVSAFLLLIRDEFVVPTLYQFGMLLLIGVFVQIGQWALTHAMASDNAGKVSAYGYIQVLFAVLLGLVFFAESPTLWTLSGGLLILAGAFINTRARASAS
ncbi:DMT family transporter [Reinekea blandensis]|uniref:EamA domain-containing protein n=1 Tax=Reinekea blandensis MED297 TaxID=314283 RepID=A4BG18_9GAMM|nr:DMT family transporter [Reinekea blandensis]EAR09036.1 hypothetical protein MED297_04067 [Reinekea sp. MED297] [Reinekea blandensis MED297]